MHLSIRKWGHKMGRVESRGHMKWSRIRRCNLLRENENVQTEGRNTYRREREGREKSHREQTIKPYPGSGLHHSIPLLQPSTQ